MEVEKCSPPLYSLPDEIFRYPFADGSVSTTLLDCNWRIALISRHFLALCNKYYYERRALSLLSYLLSKEQKNITDADEKFFMSRYRVDQEDSDRYKWFVKNFISQSIAILKDLSVPARCKAAVPLKQILSQFLTSHLYPDPVQFAKLHNSLATTLALICTAPHMNQLNIPLPLFAPAADINSIAETVFSYLEKLKIDSIECKGLKLTEVPQFSKKFLASVVEMDFKNNDLRALPEEMSLCSKLRWLSLDDNTFENIPEILATLTELKTLHLCSSRISSITENFFQNSGLRILCLANNRLSTLPKSLGNIKNLSILSIQENPFACIDKKSFTQFGSLVMVTIGADQIELLPEHIQRITRCL